MVCNGRKSALLATVYSMGSSDEKGGVPWHIHGEAYLTLLWGAKQWGLAPPGLLSAAVRGDWMIPPGRWHQDVWPGIKDPDAKAMTAPCVQVAGETLYIPEMWGHTTRNVMPVFAMGDQVPSLESQRVRPELEKHAKGVGSTVPMDIEVATYLRNTMLFRGEQHEYGRSLARKVIEESPNDMRAHHFLSISYAYMPQGAAQAIKAWKVGIETLNNATAKIPGGYPDMAEGVQVQFLEIFRNCLRNSCKLIRPQWDSWFEDVPKRYGDKSASYAGALSIKFSLAFEAYEEALELEKKKRKKSKRGKKKKGSKEFFAEALGYAQEVMKVGDFKIITPERLGQMRQVLNLAESEGQAAKAEL